MLKISILALICATSALTVATDSDGFLMKFPKIHELLRNATLKSSGDAKGTPLWEVDLDPWWDTFFNGYRQFMINQGFDSISAPELSYEFERKFLGITYRGKAGWYNGQIKGLHTLHRSGSAKLVLSSLTDDPSMGDHVALQFNAKMGVDVLSGEYIGLVNWMGYDIVDVGIKAAFSSLDVDFSGKLQTDCTYKIDRLEVILGNVDITVTDTIWPINTIIEFVMQTGANLLKVGLANAVEVGIRDFLLEHILKDLQTQFCGEPQPCRSVNFMKTLPDFSKV